MFGVAEFLRDYSRDPKYHLVWQVVSRRTEAHLDSSDGGEIDPGSVNVEELTKNVGELISGKDLRGIVAQQVQERVVFRVSAELSSRLFLGIVHILNEQVGTFSARAYDSYWKSRSLACENFEILGRKKKAALIQSLGKSKLDSKSDEIRKIEEILSDDEIVKDTTVETANEDQEKEDALTEVLKRAAEQVNTPIRRRKSNRKMFGRRQLMNFKTPEEHEEVNTEDRTLLDTPRFAEPQAEPQVDDGQDQVVEMMMAHMDGQIDGSAVKRKRRHNRNKKERSKDLTIEPEVEMLVLSPREAYADELPELPEYEPQANQVDDGQDKVAEMTMTHIDGQIDGSAVKRKRRYNRNKNAPREAEADALPELPEYMASPVGPRMNESVDLRSECTPAKRKRGRRKKKIRNNSESVGIADGTFVNQSLRSESIALEIARDASFPLVDYAASFVNSPENIMNDAEIEHINDDAGSTEYEAVVYREFKKTTGETTFREMLYSCTNRRSAMERFMGLMRLAKSKVLDVEQNSFMGEINIRTGSNFHVMPN